MTETKTPRDELQDALINSTLGMHLGQRTAALVAAAQRVLAEPDQRVPFTYSDVSEHGTGTVSGYYDGQLGVCIESFDWEPAEPDQSARIAQLTDDLEVERDRSDAACERVNQHMARIAELEADCERLRARADASDKAAEWQAKDAVKARAELAEACLHGWDACKQRDDARAQLAERRREMTEAERTACRLLESTLVLNFGLRESGWIGLAECAEALHAERHPPAPKRTWPEVLAELRQVNPGVVSNALLDELAALLKGKGTD